jgi:ribosomal protein L37AE/L43A
MPKNAPILESLNLLLPVRASCACHGENVPINMIFIPVTDEDGFYEGWGHGSEDADTDICADCEELGVLEDAFEFVFLDCEGLENAVFALRMNLRLIETLTRLIQEYNEERLTGEKVHLAIDAPCDCANEFRIFRLGQQSDNNDFANNDWDFDKPPFLEVNKAIIVSKEGVRFSCDVSTPGKNRKNLGTIVTRWFSLEDLAVINGWLVARGGGEDRKVVKHKVADDYEGGECPDCQKKIPKNAKYGDGCTGCGHIFNPVAENDDDAE